MIWKSLRDNIGDVEIIPRNLELLSDKKEQGQMRENDVPIENDFNNLKELKSIFDIFKVFIRIS